MIFTADKGEVNLLPYRKLSVPLVLSISSPGSVTGTILKKQTFINASQREYAFNHMLHFKFVPELQSLSKFEC